jgi:hypothetical protein
MSPLVLASVLIVVVIVAVLIFMLSVSGLRNRRTGATGFVQRSALTCPKCHESFEYDWVPGEALTAVRLGKYRYMACPKCRKWAMFDVWDAGVPSPPTGH